ncbi:MAG: transporter [Thermodesulfobacteriota bacterium]
MRIKITIIVLCLLSSLFAMPADTLAFMGLCCSKCGGNMPMNIAGGGVPETHEFRFKVSPEFMKMEGLLDGTDEIQPQSLTGMPAMGKFMAAQREMNMTMLNAAAGYSFTERFFGGAMFMWMKKDMNMLFSPMMKMMAKTPDYDMKSEGMGDTMLMGKYRLYSDDPLVPTSQVSLFLGLSLPTGSINEKNANHPLGMRRGEQLPYGMQLGSGTFDPSVGLLYQGSSSPLWWGANLTYTPRLYENSRGYRLGHQYRYDLYAMYQFRYNTLVQFQINGRYQNSIKGQMDELHTGQSGRAVQGDAASPIMTPLWDEDNYGGHKISTTLGLQWQPFPMHIIDISVGLPLFQDLNGPQLKDKYRVGLTWYVELPTAASIRYAAKKGKSKLGF